MSLGLRLFVAFALVHLVFSVWPGIDLWVSGWFYRPGAGFPLADSGLLGGLRSLYWNAALLALLLLVLAWGAALLLGREARVMPRLWFFAVAAFLLGPGLLVDGILKRHWHRARPADVPEFGGALPFTPPFQMAGACSKNCSFVSGEGAGAAMLVLLVGVLGWHLVPPARRRGFVLLLAGLGAFGGLMRVMTGRHFLSDVVFAGFAMTAVVLVLFALLGVTEARRSLTPANLRHDLGALREKLRGFFPRRG